VVAACAKEDAATAGSGIWWAVPEPTLKWGEQKRVFRLIPGLETHSTFFGAQIRPVNANRSTTFLEAPNCWSPAAVPAAAPPLAGPAGQNHRHRGLPPSQAGGGCGWRLAPNASSQHDCPAGQGAAQTAATTMDRRPLNQTFITAQLPESGKFQPMPESQTFASDAGSCPTHDRDKRLSPTGLTANRSLKGFGRPFAKQTPRRTGSHRHQRQVSTGAFTNRPRHVQAVLLGGPKQLDH